MQVRIGSSRHTLTEQIGKGGEGDVFRLNSTHAVKVYKPDLRSSRESKVRAMVESRIFENTSLVAFPEAVVLDLNGEFIGFTMKLVKDFKPIHQIYSPKSRRDEFPQATFNFLVRVAANVARAVGAVHEANCVIGDINHSGILVGQDATVALIDADSFQFSFKSETYGCLVGVPDFTPPELHSGSLKGKIRTTTHDYFGLAVSIFLLIFMGRHPYAGIYPREITGLSEAISKDIFAYSEKRKHLTKTQPPLNSLRLGDVPPPLEAAFEDAFGTIYDRRPSPRTWVHLLELFEKGLSKCSSRKAHIYPSHLKSCLWCDLESRTGLDLFPENYASGSLGTISSQPGINVERIISKIGALSLPLSASLLPKQVVNNATPSSKAKSLKSSAWTSKILPILGIVGAGVGLFMLPNLFFIWGIIAFASFGSLGDKLDTSAIQSNLKQAESQLEQVCNSIFKAHGYFESASIKHALEADIKSYQGMDHKLRVELDKHTKNREQILVNHYLGQFFIRKASVNGIGPVKAAELASFGIETAADVTKSSVTSVPGIGPVKAKALLAWKKSLELKFVPSASASKAYHDSQNALKAKNLAEKAALEAKIKKNFASLEQASKRISQITSALQKNGTYLSAVDSYNQAIIDLNFLVGSSIARKFEYVPDKSLFSFKQSQSSIQNSASSNKVSSSNSTKLRTKAKINQTSSKAKPSCPLCGAPMVKRLAKKGRNAGNYFWGCSKYPICKGTRNL